MAVLFKGPPVSFHVGWWEGRCNKRPVNQESPPVFLPKQPNRTPMLTTCRQRTHVLCAFGQREQGKFYLRLPGGYMSRPFRGNRKHHARFVPKRLPVFEAYEVFPSPGPVDLLGMHLGLSIYWPLIDSWPRKSANVKPKFQWLRLSFSSKRRQLAGNQFQSNASTLPKPNALPRVPASRICRTRGLKGTSLTAANLYTIALLLVAPFENHNRPASKDLHLATFLCIKQHIQNTFGACLGRLKLFHQLEAKQS